MVIPRTLFSSSCCGCPAQWSSLNIIQAPVLEPVTPDDFKDTEYLRDVDIDRENRTISELIKDAREIAESQSGRKFMTQTWCAGFNCYPDIFPFPFGNLQSVDEVRVIQPDDTASIQSVEKYSFTTGDNGLFWKRTDNGSVWTETERRFRFFEIDFTVGWVAAADVPQEIKTGIMTLVGSLYYNREDTLADPPKIFRAAKRYTF